MFKCGDCGKTFNEPDLVRESRGEFWGMPAYEDMYYCPHCGSDFIDKVEEIDKLLVESE